LSIKPRVAHVANGDAPEVLGGHAQPIGFRSLERHVIFVHIGVDIGLVKVNGKSGIFAEMAVRWKTLWPGAGGLAAAHLT
jgi:hypothetical protein